MAFILFRYHSLYTHFIEIKKIFFYCSVTVVPIFPVTLLFPAYFSPPTCNPPSTMLSLSTGPLYLFLGHPSPSFLCYPLHSSPLVTVSLFFMSMSLVLFCWFCFYSWKFVVILLYRQEGAGKKYSKS